MQIFFFHLMPWPYLPADFDRTYDSAWVTYSNSNYDPEKGHHLYNRYLDELELADQLGFDALGVNEHHQTAYGLMPSPNLMAAALARRTSRAKIAILGNALPLRDHPLRVAEEVAMLDVITGGRILSGFVRAIGSEYYSYNINPTYSRERFHEAHDLIVRAWTEPGPFSFEGKHYRFKYVNIWPKPLQKPHPPIFIPSSGSVETVAWAAANRYPFIRTYTPVKGIKPMFDDYRQRARENGYEAVPEQIGWMLPIYVAETDARAMEEAKPHLQYMFTNLVKRPFPFLIPPGYVSEASMDRKLSGINYQQSEQRSFETLVEQGVAIIGSGETVRQRLTEYMSELGCGNLTALLHFGSLPHELTVKNLHLFASEVMPHLRGLHGPATA